MGEFVAPNEKIGARLLPHVVESLGLASPQNVFAFYHVGGEDYQQGWSNMTFQQLMHAVDWASWWIEKTIGRSTSTEVVAYLGKNDLRYAIFTIASIKTGHAVRNDLHPRNAAV